MFYTAEISARGHEQAVLHYPILLTNILNQTKCRVVALQSLSVLHHNADYVFGHLGPVSSFVVGLNIQYG